MTPEYIIMTSDYDIADKTAKELGLDFGQWKWIRDRFKDPAIYKRHKLNNTGWGNKTGGWD